MPGNMIPRPLPDGRGSEGIVSERTTTVPATGIVQSREREGAGSSCANHIAHALLGFAPQFPAAAQAANYKDKENEGDERQGDCRVVILEDLSSMISESCGKIAQ